MPRVSVIIPTYNRVDVLPRAIESVLSQTEDDFELIVVDDGSTDDTHEFLATYDDPRIRSVAHGTNQGANVARNTGLSEATGEYVAFLDSDDEWRPRKLERQLRQLERRSEDWVGAYCDFEIRSQGTSGRLEMLGARILAHSKPRGVREGGEELVGEILADNVQPGAGSTLIVRTEVARRVGGFDETLDRFQDPEFVLRILEEGKLACVDEPLVIRYDTGSPDADIVATADAQYLSAYRDQIAEFEAKGYDIEGSHNLLLAKEYLAEGRFLRGLRCLLDASVRARHYPGVLWAVASGVQRRPRPVVLVLVTVALFLAAWLSLLS